MPQPKSFWKKLPIFLNVNVTLISISFLLLSCLPVQAFTLIASATTPKPSTAMKIPLAKLTSHANSYAAAHGLQVESKSSSSSSSSSSYQCAPISLLPNIFPQSLFQQAQAVAPHFNTLVDRISRDGDFLHQTLGGGVIANDAYTRKLLELYTQIYMTSPKDDSFWNFALEADRMGIQRSDYMLNGKKGGQRGEYEMKQVELNTIASSFAGLAVNVAGLHRMLLGRYGSEVQDWIQTNQEAVMGSNYKADENAGVPINPALQNLPKAMSLAHERYLSRFANQNEEENGEKEIPKVVLFVVQEGETNTVDQRMLEFQLWERHQVPVVRMSLTRLHSQMKIDEETGAFYIVPDTSADGELGMVAETCEVSLVYFRAGYAPTDYPDGYDGIEWQVREWMERSRATKCPSLGYHLAGTKKVQQELARPMVLERFFDEVMDKEAIEGMRRVFAGLYSLGEDAEDVDLDAVSDVLSGSQAQYVLKPQREGGGYNYYGDNLSEMIKKNVVLEGNKPVLGKDLAEFILMQRLFPPKQRAVLLRAGMVEGTGDSISELGCFGTILQGFDGEPLHNEYGGFLLRTKFENVDEGGVASGFATLSSPYLC